MSRQRRATVKLFARDDDDLSLPVLRVAFPAAQRAASGRVGDQGEVAGALVVDGRVLVDERALPDRFEVGGELELVNVARMEASHLARDDRLHLVLDGGARLPRL